MLRENSWVLMVINEITPLYICSCLYWFPHALRLSGYFPGTALREPTTMIFQIAHDCDTFCHGRMEGRTYSSGIVRSGLFFGG